MLIGDEQVLVDGIPPEIMEKIDGCNETVSIQVGMAWSLKDKPLPENYIPELVDVYVDGSDEPCLALYKGKILVVNQEFFANRHKATVIISIEEDARYVEINGELIADSLGGCVMPELLVSPQAQVSFLSALLNMSEFKNISG